MSSQTTDCIRASWPVPPAVRAVSTTRRGGVSAGVYASLNLGDHVGDSADNVAQNRALLERDLQLPGPVRWLRQVHGVAVAAGPELAHNPVADAAVSHRPGEVLAIMTADCLPVVLADRYGTCVAAAHAGWRSLAGGVLEATVARLGATSADLVAWFGPAIGPESYEVGEEVRAAFVDHDSTAAAAFRQSRPGHWLADLYELARARLAACGVTDVHGGEHCTVRDPERFFSYRRDGQCGRMATLVWIESD